MGERQRERDGSANQQRDAKTKFSSKARSSALFRHNDPLKEFLRGRRGGGRGGGDHTNRSNHHHRVCVGGYHLC